MLLTTPRHSCAWWVESALVTCRLRRESVLRWGLVLRIYCDCLSYAGERTDHNFGVSIILPYFLGLLLCGSHIKIQWWFARYHVTALKVCIDPPTSIGVEHIVDLRQLIFVVFVGWYKVPPIQFIGIVLILASIYNLFVFSCYNRFCASLFQVFLALKVKLPALIILSCLLILLTELCNNLWNLLVCYAGLLEDVAEVINSYFVALDHLQFC